MGKTMRHTFTHSSIVFVPREEVWAFYSDTKNLNQISPKYARVTIEHADLPMRSGSEVIVRTPWPLKMRWHVQVIDYVHNHHFIDQQISGPFRFWRHTHLFEPSDVGTRLTDKVEFTLPPLFHWFAAPIVHLLLKVYFAHRHRMTRQLLENRGAHRRPHRFETISMRRYSPER